MSDMSHSGVGEEALVMGYSLTVKIYRDISRLKLGRKCGDDG